MQIGVRKLIGVPAALTDAARRIGSFAKQRACEPEREPLLADAGRPVQQQARWQATGAGCREKAAPERVMAEQRDDWHAGI